MNDHTLGLNLVWQIAAMETAHRKHKFIEPEHLFIGLCKLEDFAAVVRLCKIILPGVPVATVQAETGALLELFSHFGLDPTALRREMRERKGTGVLEMADRQDRTIHRSLQSRWVFACADELARGTGAPATAIFHLLAALLDEAPSADGVESAIVPWLRAKGVDVTGLREAALATPLPPLAEAGLEMYPFEGKEILDLYGRDLTQLARQGEIQAAVGREPEMRQIIRTLSRVTKNNPLLIGEAGVGKTALVEGLAWRIAQGDVPQAIRGKRIVQINLVDLVVGTKHWRQLEERLQSLVREVAADPDIILFIDETHVVVGAGTGKGVPGAANILKPALVRGDLRCIGATTLDEYRKYIERDPILESRFQPISVD